MERVYFNIFYSQATFVSKCCNTCICRQLYLFTDIHGVVCICFFIWPCSEYCVLWLLASLNFTIYSWMIPCPYQTTWNCTCLRPSILPYTHYRPTLYCTTCMYRMLASVLEFTIHLWRTGGLSGSLSVLAGKYVQTDSLVKCLLANVN